MADILIIRLSAIGDVAMTVPAVYSAARANPSDSFTILTQTFLMPLFIHRPANVHVIGINTKSSEKTLFGFLRFASALIRYRYDVVIDLHSVIRTWIIDALFRLKGTRVVRLRKGRKEREAIVSKPPKEIHPLRAVTDLYADTLHKAGILFDNTFTSLYDNHPVDETAIDEMAGPKSARWIGIAPFAKYRGKIYPPDEMEKVVEMLSKQGDMEIFLFGGKGYEQVVLDQWEFQYPHTHNMAGRYPLDRELALISRLDLLVCMDSANMHFASLTGTKVISIWGATHPYAGFYGYRQSPDNAIQTDLPCRPCSIFGNKACYRGDWACMAQITPEHIIAKINKTLKEE